MAPNEISEEEISLIVQDQVGESIQEQIDEEIREVTKEAVYLKVNEKILDELEKTVRDVVDGVESRVDDEVRRKCDIEGLAIARVFEAISENQSSSGSSMDVPLIADRSNNGKSTKQAKSDTEGPRTRTVEVPIEGGDVEDPDTVEVERLDPEPMDFNVAEKIVRESERLNAKQDSAEDDETDPGEIDATGRESWYEDSEEYEDSEPYFQ